MNAVERPPVHATATATTSRTVRVRPEAADLAIAFFGILCTAGGAAMFHVGAGLIVLGIGMFYLGAWHK